LGFGFDHCVVTFDSYTDFRTLDRQGFGEEFLSARGINAIHVISRDNDWYQHEEMPSVAALIADAVKPYRRVVAYGSSMGGYAAIRFGRAVGGHVALALSPQFSIDPEVAPFENRWLGEASRINSFRIEKEFADAGIETAYIVYDPYDADRHHVALLKNLTKVIEMHIPHAGHPVTGFLAEAGILQNLVIDVVSGTVDRARFQQSARSARKQTPQFLFVLSRKSRNIETKVALARRAVELAPGNVVYLSHYGTVLALSGDFARAEDVFSNCLGLHPENPVLLYHMSEMYEIAGDLDKALERMQYLTALHPDAKIYSARLNYLSACIDSREKSEPPEPCVAENIPAAQETTAAPAKRTPFKWASRILGAVPPRRPIKDAPT
jgi:tetratricopeptide (TPR) repeat protein